MQQAVESYYNREGRYPQSLRQLVPWYVAWLPGPVIVNGQDWCYDGGDGYYRLGYVDRNHWSAPDWFGRLYNAVAAPPDLPPLCQQAVAGQRERSRLY